MLDHPAVLRLHEVFENDESVFLITDLLSGGELFKRAYKQRLTEAQAAHIIKILAEALDYVHSKEVIHRDLKLENIMLNDPNSFEGLKIVDFGLATTQTNNDLMKKCGTPGFVAPEVLLEKPYTTKADCFSLGVCIFLM
jgi:serine/threonine protein kinase